MKININNFFTFDRQKNGNSKISFSLSNEGNIYKFLRELGFCKSKIDNKNVLYRRLENNFSVTNFQDMKITFWNLLKQGEFENMPEQLKCEDILNYYLQKNPIKQNGLFDHYLEDNLTEQEVLKLKLLTDYKFNHKFKVNTLLSKFNEWTFHKTIDSVGTFCKDNTLYYKNIGDKKYLVFNHYNEKDRTKDGFDTWVATYKNEKLIGTKRPTEFENLKLSFHLDRDYSLIEQYLN